MASRRLLRVPVSRPSRTCPPSYVERLEPANHCRTACRPQTRQLHQLAAPALPTNGSGLYVPPSVHLLRLSPPATRSVSKSSRRALTRPRTWLRCFVQPSGPSEDPSNSVTPVPPSPKQPLRKRMLPLTPHENIYTIPNLLTFSRLAAAPVLGYMILHDAHAWTLGLFVYAGATDLLDGWLARRLNQQTVVGSVVDPMADKALMMSTTIALAIQGSMPPYLALIILGRDAGLGVAAIYYRWISLPPPKTFGRYWDFSLPSAEVRPTTISKYNTLFQLALIGATVALPMAQELGLGGASVLGIGLHDALRGMQWGVATTTVWSGLSYVYSKDAVRILTPEEGMAKEAEQKRERAEQEQEQKP